MLTCVLTAHGSDSPDWEVVPKKKVRKLSQAELDSKLMLALQQGNTKLAKQYARKGANVNWVNTANGLTPLQYFAPKGASKAVKFLLANKADVNVRLADGANTLILMARINTSAADIVQMLIDAKIDVNAIDSYGMNALAYYVQSGNEQMVRALLKAPNIVLTGSNSIDAPSAAEETDKTKAFKNSPIWFAAANGYTTIVSALLTKEPTLAYERGGVDGSTPLIIAAKNCHADTVETLLKTVEQYETKFSAVTRYIDHQNDEHVTATMFSAARCCVNDSQTLYVLLGSNPDLTLIGPGKEVDDPHYGTKRVNPQTIYDYASYATSKTTEFGHCPGNTQLLCTRYKVKPACAN